MDQHQNISKASESIVNATSDAIRQRRTDVEAFVEALKELTLDQYQEISRRTYKTGRLLGHVLGVAGEAGEIAELVKKSVYHDVGYASDKMLSELGDLLFYLSAVALDHGFTLERVARFNIQKLEKRYPNGFVAGGGIRDVPPDVPSIGCPEVPNGGANG